MKLTIATFSVDLIIYSILRDNLCKIDSKHSFNRRQIDEGLSPHLPRIDLLYMI